jgi:hypothetical protein
MLLTKIPASGGILDKPIFSRTGAIPQNKAARMENK